MPAALTETLGLYPLCDRHGEWKCAFAFGLLTNLQIHALCGSEYKGVRPVKDVTRAHIVVVARTSSDKVSTRLVVDFSGFVLHTHWDLFIKLKHVDFVAWQNGMRAWHTITVECEARILVTHPGWAPVFLESCLSCVGSLSNRSITLRRGDAWKIKSPFSFKFISHNANFYDKT